MSRMILRLSAWSSTKRMRLLMTRPYLPLDRDREREHKRRTVPRLGFDPNPAAMHLDDALRYSKPQAGAALLASDRVVGLLELLKQLGLIGSGDTRTGVTDRYIE